MSATAEIEGFPSRLARALWSEPPTGNQVLSPASIALMLLLLHRGAKGETRAGIARALGIDGLDDDRAAALAQALLGAATTGETDLLVATALHVHPALALAPDALETARRVFDAEIFPLDNDVEPINAWVREKTRGRIKSVVEPGANPDVPMLFAALNAVYFRGRWRECFEPGDTVEQTFWLSDDSCVDHPLMHSVETFPYREVRGGGVRWQAVALPYLPVRAENGSDGLAHLEGFVMEIWLPEPGADPAAALAALPLDASVTGRPGPHEYLAEDDARVILPRFAAAGGFELKDALRSLGMDDAFDAETGDFRGFLPMTVPVFLGTVVHKATVEVDEEGTVATAVTFDPGMLSGLPPIESPWPMVRCDRPFGWVIRDERSGFPWFTGLVHDPSSGKPVGRAPTPIDAVYLGTPATGPTLSKLCRVYAKAWRRDQTLPPRDDGLRRIAELGQCLAHLHEAGGAHGHLAPGAVVYDGDGRTRLRRPPRPWLDETHPHPGYAPPGLTGHRRDPVPADDVFALAAIAYLLLSGRHPFEEQRSVARAVRDGVEPEWLDHLSRRQNQELRHGLEFDAELRSSSVGVFLRGIGAVPDHRSAWARLKEFVIG